MILLKSVILCMGSGSVGSIFVEIDGGIFRSPISVLFFYLIFSKLR